jgi:hypothetical protein
VDENWRTGQLGKLLRGLGFVLGALSAGL